MTEHRKLFAVYLGGRAPKGNTELHDVVFVTGNSIEDTYWQCMEKWFGTPKGLHLDSWMELDVVDGFRIGLNGTKSANDKKLYFVNLGAYKDGAFTEIHANKFLVASSASEAKARAKRDLLKDWPGAVHTDDVYEVDSCIEFGSVNGFHITLTETGEQENLQPHNAYHIIPKASVEDYMERNGIKESSECREAYTSS